ncbi:IS200/IS605 family element transposase accessory protein TnpB [Catellatospora chokoriensis]|uniref:Transposase n=1 Tax=Catellatospora chokoriensis TaxID=310353 RepID=A0A8J3NVY5_9ACTN|nr:transposase [Catellatospora chokoriensis]
MTAGFPRVLRPVAAPFVATGPSGVAVRDRLKHLTPADAHVLALIGQHLGGLASADLQARCRDGHEHDADRWAARKRSLTGVSSSRWAGAITRASHDQWALARRNLDAHIRALEAGMAILGHRLAQPLGQPGAKHAPGGYRSRQEWFGKSRRLAMLRDRHTAAVKDWRDGRVRVVRGGRRLANTRHHLDQAGLTEAQWRQRWQAARRFLSADGETGKRYGNETIRVTPDGQVSIKLPVPLAHLANTAHGRYTLPGRVVFAHRGAGWRDRVEANLAVAYRIHYDPQRGRWYLTASWQQPQVQTIPLAAARAAGMVGVDMNADHLAAWLLDVHGNPVGDPRRFGYDLSGGADRRDAQIRHAITGLLHYAKRAGVTAIAVEDLDFTGEKSREKHGRRRRFRQLISGMPTGRLKARLVSMAAAVGLAVVAVDPAYTSKWGAEHWQQPMATPRRKPTRHDGAAIAIARRALGHRIRRRTPPPRDDQSDRCGHRSVQARPGVPGREGPRPGAPGSRTRCAPPDTAVKAGDQRAQHRSGHTAAHTQLMHSH